MPNLSYCRQSRPCLAIGIQRKQHSTDVIGEHVDNKPFLSPGSNEIARPLRAIHLLPFITTIKLNLVIYMAIWMHPVQQVLLQEHEYVSIGYCRNVCMDQLNNATSVGPNPSSVYNMFVSQYLYYTHYFIFISVLFFN